MDRQTFLDAQSWLRRLRQDEFQWSDGARQLLPPVETPTARPPFMGCSGCLQQASRICYFRATDAGEDQTMLPVELAAAECHRGGPSKLLVRFDREATFEIALSAIRSVVRPVGPHPDGASAGRLPPFGELDFGSVRLRMWLEPLDAAPHDARRAINDALQRVEMLRSDRLKCRQDRNDLPNPVQHVLRHNPWIHSTPNETSSKALLVVPELLARGATAFKSTVDQDTLKTVVDTFLQRKRKREEDAESRHRQEKTERVSEEGTSEEPIEHAQRDPESEGSNPLSAAASFDLLSSLIHAFGDNHTGLQRLLRIHEDSDCAEHEQCSALPKDADTPCVLRKWRKWEDFLQLANNAFPATSKRQRTSGVVNATSESNAVVLEAGKTLASALLDPQDAEALETSHSSARDRLEALEELAFSALFPKPTGVPIPGLRPPRTPVAPRRRQPTLPPTPPRHPDHNGDVVRAERVLNLLVEARRALVRRELTTQCLPLRTDGYTCSTHK